MNIMSIIEQNHFMKEGRKALPHCTPNLP